MRFPELHARDLDDNPVALPSDLGPGPTLLLVRFSPQSDHEVETWYPLVADLVDAASDFWCYDLVVLPAFPEGAKASLADELRVAVADGGDQSGVRSLTAHTDVAAFRRSLVLDRPAQTYALVLCGGRVRWRAFGPLTTPLARRLRETVASLAANGSDDLVAS